jgi:hypothetical protein
MSAIAARRRERPRRLPEELRPKAKTGALQFPPDVRADPVGEALQAGLVGIYPVAEAVVGDHRGDRREQADGGGEQRLRDARRDHRERGVLLLADLEEAVHDAPDGAEQPDEGRHRAGRGEEVEPLGERIRLGRHLPLHRQGDAPAGCLAVRDPAARSGRVPQFLQAGRGHARRGRFVPPAVEHRLGVLSLEELALERLAAARHLAHSEREADDDRPGPHARQDQPDHDRLDNDVGVEEQLDRVEPIGRGGGVLDGGEEVDRHAAVLSSISVAKAARQPWG